MDEVSKEKVKFIMNVLRLGTLTWEGRNQVFRNHRVQKQIGFYKNGNPKFKFFYFCAKCNHESPNQLDFEADHIEEVGPFLGSWDLWIERLYATPIKEKWQSLCLPCHSRKSATYAANKLYVRKPK